MEKEIDRAGYALVLGPQDADRAAAESTLLQGGLAVATATLAEALAIPDLTPPRLMVLDDSTTPEARTAALRQIRHHPPLQGVPLLVLAYDADIDSYSTAITKGAAAYLIKPVDPEELLAVARRLSGWTGHSDKTERRRRLRRPLLMKVEVEVRSRKVKLPGTMVDASGGGCRVELSEEVPKGELVRVILHTHDTTTHLALGAEVRWYNRAPSGVHVIGVRFTGTTAMLAGKLLGFVSSGMT